MQAIKNTYTEQRKNRAINALLEVKKAALNGDYAVERSKGICDKWDKQLKGYEACYTLVMKYSPSWEHFSGNCSYPIGAGFEDFWAQDLLWVGKPLEQRLSLIDHIISKMHTQTPEEIFNFN